MNTVCHQQRNHNAARNRRTAFARFWLMMAATAYFITALQIAPLAFSWLGTVLDSDHQSRISIVENGGVRVTLTHHLSCRHNKHRHAWLSDVVVGSVQGGHPDHFANFESVGNGLTAESDGLDVKCPVSQLADFEWLAMPESAHVHDFSGAFSVENMAPPDIRPTRPVVLLI